MARFIWLLDCNWLFCRCMQFDCYSGVCARWQRKKSETFQTRLQGLDMHFHAIDFQRSFQRIAYARPNPVTRNCVICLAIPANIISNLTLPQFFNRFSAQFRFLRSKFFLNRRRCECFSRPFRNLIQVTWPAPIIHLLCISNLFPAAFFLRYWFFTIFCFCQGCLSASFCFSEMALILYWQLAKVGTQLTGTLQVNL